jgi:predicted dehydrogenase
MYDMGVYHIANMLYLLSNCHLRVSGKTYQKRYRRTASSSGYDVEEAAVFVRMDKNISWISSDPDNPLNGFEGCSVVGSKGGIRLEPFGFYQNVGDLEMDRPSTPVPLTGACTG